MKAGGRLNPKRRDRSLALAEKQGMQVNYPLILFLLVMRINIVYI